MVAESCSCAVGLAGRVGLVVADVAWFARPRASVPLPDQPDRPDLSSFTAAPMSAGLLTTWTPAAVSAAIFSAAVPLPPGDDRAGVTHAAARRRGLAGDEPDDRLLEVRLDPAAASSSAEPPISPIMITASVSGSAANSVERVDVHRADQRIAADADAGRLPEPEARQLIDGLVGERAALRDDADAAFAADVAPG